MYQPQHHNKHLWDLFQACKQTVQKGTDKSISTVSVCWEMGDNSDGKTERQKQIEKETLELESKRIANAKLEKKEAEAKAAAGMNIPITTFPLLI